jgi:hypothetical protein
MIEGREKQRGMALCNGPPERIAINHDDYHAEHIGRTRDGRQFFVTTLFEPRTDDSPGCEYVARFLFDLAGNLVESEIQGFGPRATMDEERRRQEGPASSHRSSVYPVVSTWRWATTGRRSLKSQGYTIACIGKWHLGPVSCPSTRQGFDCYLEIPYNDTTGKKPG